MKTTRKKDADLKTQMLTFRLTPMEKKELQETARFFNITVTQTMREFLRIALGKVS